MLTWQIMVLVVLSVACSALAQMALKFGMTRDYVQLAMQGAPGPVAVALAIAGSPAVWAGLFVYGLSALLWLFVLARVDVSVAYAFVALGFLMVMALGALVFGEPITWRKLLGTALVATGIWLVATSARGPQAGAPGQAAIAAREAGPDSR